ncbi:MAG: FAD-dependent oxidoreductase [Planctomycetes bacterium]|nr:FAD-dependent oxidoreductase [Planctomycetota bacterium]
MNREHCVVIGAGIIGISSAYYLAKRGYQVTVIERGEIGNGASFGSAGIIAVGHPTMPRPGLVSQTLKWMVDKTSPIQIKPRLSLELAKWLWQFRGACNAKHEAHCMDILSTLGLISKECFDSIVNEENIDCDYRTEGWYEVYRTTNGMKQGHADAQLLGKYNIDVDVLGGQEMRDSEPMLKPGVVGAIHYVQSALADPQRFLVGLADAAVNKGVNLLTNTSVTSLKLRSGECVGVVTKEQGVIEADTVILAAGVWSTQLAKSVGVNVPMQAGKGYHRNVTCPELCLTNTCVLAESYTAAAPMSGYLRLSGTVELSGINHRLNSKRLEMLTQGASEFLEGMEQTEIISEWCGLRPCTPDGLPVIDWAPGVQGLFLATGHARMGFTLGPATGKLVSELILGDSPCVEPHALKADRFRQSKRHRITAVH